MKIKKFAEMTNLTPRTIRFYEEKGIFKSQRHPINDYRIYTEENVEIAKRISHFRNLGFSIADISSMLKDSPNLSVEQLTDKVARNLEKLQNEMTDLELKIKESEDLLKTAKKNALMNEKQKQLLINADSLMSWMTKYVQERLHKKVIGQDEELQIVACAYADLMLKVAGTGGFSDFGKAHQMIEKCLIKIREPRLAKRHAGLAKAYFNMAADPNWQPPEKSKRKKK
jgi:DNA-binding transcriptional MerR regulator